MGDDAAAGRFDDTHDNADRLLLLINAFDENLADFAGAKNWKWLKEIRIHKFENKLQRDTLRLCRRTLLKEWFKGLA